jgi:hypothetical protein
LEADVAFHDKMQLVSSSFGGPTMRSGPGLGDVLSIREGAAAYSGPREHWFGKLQFLIDFVPDLTAI